VPVGRDRSCTSVEGGETLIEVLIAIAIIGIVAAALVGALLTSLEGSSANQRAAQADGALRSAAADVFSSAAAPSAWDPSGCLSVPVQVREPVTVTPVTPAGSCAGFEELELTLDGSTAAPLHIWVRQP